LKFGYMSSDVSEPPSVIKKLEGHSKDVTGLINWYCFYGFFLYFGS
jgi:hypothetical protein